MRLRPSSGWPGRITHPPPWAAPGVRFTWRAQFSPSLPDGGRGGTAAFARDNSGPTDEGRKDAAEGRKESVNDGPRARDLGLASFRPRVWRAQRRLPHRAQPATASCGEWRRHGCLDLHRADSADLRPSRPGAEVGRRTMNYENIVGLVLSVLTALYLAGALLFPERF